MMQIQQHVVMHKTSEYPSALKTALEISGSDTLPLEKLIAYTEAGYIPHYRIDGGEFLYRSGEVKSWIAKNLMGRCNGADLPYELKITVPAEKISTYPPSSISNLPNLQQVPKYGFNSGIYFLCFGDEVVYVGQSTSPASRIASHVLEGKKVFDRVYLLPIPEQDLNNVETAFIKTFNPKYNGKIRGTDKPLTLQATEDAESVFSRIGYVVEV